MDATLQWPVAVRLEGLPNPSQKKLCTQIKFKLFSKLHSKKDRRCSLMGIYWLYPLYPSQTKRPNQPPLLNPRSKNLYQLHIGLFSAYFFTVWNSHCILTRFSFLFFSINFTLHFYCFASFKIFMTARFLYVFLWILFFCPFILLFWYIFWNLDLTHAFWWISKGAAC